MRPYEAYAIIKAAEDASMYDQFKQHVNTARDYLKSHKAGMAQSAANNVAYGLMSNPRGLGSSSLFGASAGGVVDGILMKPVAEAALSLADRGLRKFYNVAEHPPQ